MLFLKDIDFFDLKLSAQEVRSIEYLQKWITNHKEINNYYDNRVLLKYLHSCKGDLEKCVTKIWKFLVFKRELSVILDHLGDVDIKEVMKNDILLGYSNGLTKSGHRIACVALPTSQVSAIDVHRQLKFCAMAILRMTLDLHSKGDILVYDCKNLTASHLKLLWEPMNRKVFLRSPGVFPIVLHQVHLINLPSILRTLLPYFVKPKIRQRMFIHESPEGLFDYLPEECVPDDYGGSAGSLEQLTLEAYEKTVEFAHLYPEFRRFALI